MRKNKRLLMMICLTLCWTVQLQADAIFLYNPMRSQQVVAPAPDEVQSVTCKLCKALEPDNGAEFPIFTTQSFTVMLNVYPYAKGHLLIVANDHGTILERLSSEQQEELMHVITFTVKTIKKVLDCPGVNVGYNEGRCAGASVSDHLHVHVLPRYEKWDRSFLQAITGTQLVQWDFQQIQELLRPHFKKLCS